MSIIEGLKYIPDYLTESREQELIGLIDQQPWLADLKRRVQHYGYKYDYKARAIDPGMFLGSFPEWVVILANELQTRGLFPRTPDQLIINEYKPGQGISPHVDCGPCFDDTIASITLGSGCMMDFTKGKEGPKISKYLEPRSILVLSGASRYDWRYSIAPRKSDIYEGSKVHRDRRISLTFRNVLLKGIVYKGLDS